MAARLKACVFGAGAIGGHLAARLSRNGAEVSVVARGPHLAAIRDDGLRVRFGDETWTEHVVASDDPSDLGPQDVVLVTVKQTALPAVAGLIGPLLGPDTGVAFVMNGMPWWYFHGIGGEMEGRRLEGIDPGGAVWDAVGPERVIGAVVYSAAEVIAPGVVRVENANGRIILGEPDGSNSRRLQRLVEALDSEELKALASTSIRDAVWSKLVSNIASGPLAMLTQLPLDRLYADPVAERAVRQVVVEMSAAARALGAAPSITPDQEVVRGLRLAHRPSILQDLERGRPVETEAIYRTPLAMAREAGVEMPVTELLVGLAALRAAGAAAAREGG